MIFSDFLSALGIAHTNKYSDNRFKNMPFKSWFGMSKLLTEYGADSQGIMVSDKSQILQLQTPFVAALNGGEWVIVTKANASEVAYISQGTTENATLNGFTADWTGDAFLARAQSNALEPDYRSHKLVEVMTRIRNYGIVALLVILAAYFFITNNIYKYWWAYFLLFFYALGLAASVGLILKDLGIKSKTLDSVCATLREGGCETVMDSGGVFLGIFHWSQVGLTYFSISLITFLTIPSLWPWLALLGVCCLPYTIWSILYQRFVAHSWCTLCLTVQTSFWIIFAFWIPSGWWNALEWSFALIVLLLIYGITMLCINAIMPDIILPKKDD